MQYIKKQNKPPVDWDWWFTKATKVRSFDYALDSSSLTRLQLAKEFLINEQNGLCAYCQTPLTIGNSSIEHVIPKGFNKELSTNYFNLVAVCNLRDKDPETGKLHCDNEKGSSLVSPVIFDTRTASTGNAVNFYFAAFANGEIRPRNGLPDVTRIQVESFIEITNLNHKILKEKRVKDVLNGLIDAYQSIPKNSHHKSRFWPSQYKRIFLNPGHPFREYLLIFIGRKLGYN